MNTSYNETVVKKLKQGRIAAYLCLAVSVLTLIAAVLSFLLPDIYQNAIDRGVMAVGLLPGSLAQDGVNIVAALSTVALSAVYLRKPSPKVLIALVGLAGNFLYGYGLYTMEGNFTYLYPIYLAIFSLSIFALIFGLTGISRGAASGAMLGTGLRRAIGVFLLVIMVIFVSLWSVMVVGNTANNTRPDAYGVFILDLCFVMPSFAIIAVLLLKNKGFGIALAGAALVKTFTLILSVAIAEASGPSYGLVPNMPMIMVYSAIVLVSFVLGMLYFIRLKLGAAIEA